jgi:carboxylate-amine ligase
LTPIAAAVAPFDPDGVLDPIWVNARGAIARFDRGSIEIRVLDTQECPLADVALVAAVVGLVRALTEERWTTLAAQRSWEAARLRSVFDATVRDGGGARIDDADYLLLFGLSELAGQTAHSLWTELCRRLEHERFVSAQFDRVFEAWARGGCLSRRIAASLPERPARSDLVPVYESLCDCLRNGTLFEASAA